MQQICVFCGTSTGANHAYVKHAQHLGQVLVEKNITLIYGASSDGVMAAIANAMLAAGGKVIGVIPHALCERADVHTGLTELHLVDTMHQRKALMNELADGFITLPGGIGTMEEFFEMWTWAQLGVHQKPCGLLNIASYYDPLLAFLEHMVAQRFLRPEHRELVYVETNPERLIAHLSAYSPAKRGQNLDITKT